MTDQNEVHHTSSDDEPEHEEALFEEATAAGSAPYKELSEYIGRATVYGLYPIVAYGLDPQGRPDMLAVATSPIPDLAVSLDLVNRTARIKMSTVYHPGMFIPLSLLETIVEKNRIMSWHCEEIPGLDTENPDHRKAIRHLVAFCTASKWTNRAFLLVDVVGFSLASTTEQLALRMSLGQSINQVRYRMLGLQKQGLVLPPNFNRLSTGDGFYFFSWHSISQAHITSFVFMLLLMAQTESLFDRTGLRLRSAFAIGEAYTFPYRGPGLFPNMDEATSFMPDAIGPVLNDLQRLIAAASPGQILAQHFDEPGREERKHERLNVSTMLTRVKAEILPRELSVDDPIKSQDIKLELDPPGPLRVTDKHKRVHHCYNIWGQIPTRTEERLALQNIGLRIDTSDEVEEASFRLPESL